MGCLTEKIVEGTSGAPIRVQVLDKDRNIQDMTLATGLSMKLRAPSGITKLALVAVLGPTPLNGEVDHILAAGDLDEVGTWYAQVMFTLLGVTTETWPDDGDFVVLESFA